MFTNEEKDLMTELMMTIGAIVTMHVTHHTGYFMNIESAKHAITEDNESIHIQFFDKNQSEEAKSIWMKKDQLFADIQQIGIAKVATRILFEYEGVQLPIK